MRSLALYSIAFIFEGNGFQLKKTGEMMNEGEKTGELKHAMSQKACCDEGEKKPCCEEHKALPRGPAREPPSERGEGPSTKSELNTPNEYTKSSKQPHAYKGKKSENVREAIDAQAKTGKKGDGKTGKQAAEHVGQAEQPVKRQAVIGGYVQNVLSMFPKSSLIATAVFVVIGGVLAYFLAKHVDVTSETYKGIFDKINCAGDSIDKKHVVAAVIFIPLYVIKLFIYKVAKITTTFKQEIVNAATQFALYLVTYISVYKLFSAVKNNSSAAFAELSKHTEATNSTSGLMPLGSVGIEPLMSPAGNNSSGFPVGNNHVRNDVSTHLADSGPLGSSAGNGPLESDASNSAWGSSASKGPWDPSVDNKSPMPLADGNPRFPATGNDLVMSPIAGNTGTPSASKGPVMSAAADPNDNQWGLFAGQGGDPSGMTTADNGNARRDPLTHSSASFMETISSIPLIGSSVQNNMRMRSRETIVQIV